MSAHTRSIQGQGDTTRRCTVQQCMLRVVSRQGGGCFIKVNDLRRRHVPSSLIHGYSCWWFSLRRQGMSVGRDQSVHTHNSNLAASPIAYETNRISKLLKLQLCQRLFTMEIRGYRQWHDSWCYGEAIVARDGRMVVSTREVTPCECHTQSWVSTWYACVSENH